MSTPAGSTWTDVIDSFMSAIKNVLYEIGNFISTNATAIAEAVIGVGIAYGIARLLLRMPMVRGLLGRFF